MIGKSIQRMENIAFPHTSDTRYTYTLCLKQSPVLAIADCRTSSDNSNSLATTNCWLQTNKQIATMQDCGDNKNENHHKHNIHATFQVCQHCAHCSMHMQ